MKRRGPSVPEARPGVIAVWGPPGSGKTSVAVSLAIRLAGKGRSAAVVCCDRVAPALPALFPCRRGRDIRSLGEALTAVDISVNGVLACSNTVREQPDLIFLGYSTAENLYSYPESGKGRSALFLETVAETAGTVVCDCSSDIQSDPLSSAALSMAYAAVLLYPPELKTVSFYDSQLGALRDLPDAGRRILKVLNRVSRDCFYPEDEIAGYMDRPEITLPFSAALRRAAAEGTLVSSPAPGRFGRAVGALAGLCAAVPATF
jgi:MinD-like ATPase involved in chromosome partitioning or flagellar assembly